ncbi:hypothetical protein [Kamptonema sp. PCC 6506]|nr:hypothetical protein [Kamptonema sp. PCC 6506]CBN57335.1 hypothetical protein OSCI_3400038 [Kamptonema sp. PCC 6506]
MVIETYYFSDVAKIVARTIHNSILQGTGARDPDSGYEDMKQ